MEIYENVDPKKGGQTTIVLDKADGQALTVALQIAMREMRKGTKAYKVAKAIDDNLPVF